MSLREEIDRRLASNQVHYAHFVTHNDMQRIRKETTDEILKLIEKRIDAIARLEWDNEINDTNGFRYAIEKVKELLK